MSSIKSTSRQLFVFFILALTTLPMTSFATSLIVRVDPDYYPVTYRENNHKASQDQNDWKGMDIDIIREMFSRSGLDFDIVTMPFKRSLFEIKEGHIHMMPNLTLSEERSEYLNWLGPTRTTCIGLVVQSKDAKTPINSLRDLVDLATRRNLKVGYLSGASYSRYFDHALEKDEKLIEALHFLPNNNQHMKMLKLGRILGYFFDEYEIMHRMNTPPYADEYKGLSLHSYRIEGSCTGAFIGISKNLNRETQEKLFNSFKSLKTDGTFERIYKQWVDPSIPMP